MHITQLFLFLFFWVFWGFIFHNCMCVYSFHNCICVYLPDRWLNGKQTKTTRISQTPSNFKILELNINFFFINGKSPYFSWIIFCNRSCCIIYDFCKTLFLYMVICFPLSRDGSLVRKLVLLPKQRGCGPILRQWQRELKMR